MAELIDKKTTMKLFDNCGLSMSRTFVKNRISNMPTTTESEIRAKAQREIVEWCFDNEVDFNILGIFADKERVVDCVLKHFMAEQLKGE